MSLWKTAQKKAKSRSFTANFYSILSYRAKLENERPNHIDHAEMKEIVEGGLLKKAETVKIDRNPLNITYFVLKNPKTSKYFRIDEKEKFLWDRMDGSHTIRDLALEYYNEYGSFAYEKIIELVYDLKKKTFLEKDYINLFEKLSLWAKSRQIIHKLLAVAKKALSWEFPIKQSDKFFGYLYKSVFKYLFHPLSQAVLLALTFGGFVAFATLFVFGHFMLISKETAVFEVPLMLVLIIISLLIHEIAHGVATKHFNRHIHKAGFLLYFGWPTLYVDTTDMWMEEKRKRIVVTAAGPFAEFMIAGLLSIVLLALPVNPISSFLYKFAFVSYLSVFMNLNPLIEWDGYFILMDILGIPCLRLRSLDFIRNKLLAKLGKKEKFTKEDKLYTGFGLLSAIWSVVAVFLAFRFWQRIVIQFL